MTMTMILMMMRTMTMTMLVMITTGVQDSVAGLAFAQPVSTFCSLLVALVSVGCCGSPYL